jgi:hypothetical protein
VCRSNFAFHARPVRPVTTSATDARLEEILLDTKESEKFLSFARSMYAEEQVLFCIAVNVYLSPTYPATLPTRSFPF